MEMEMNESPTKDTSDSSGGTGGSFSPPLKRLRKASTDTTLTDADAHADDSDSKTLSTISSISEGFGAPLLSQHPSDPFQAVVLTRTSTIATADADADAVVDTDNKTSSGEEIGKRRYSTLEEFLTNNKYSWEECKDFLMTIDRRPKLDSQSEIETWRVDPSRLYCYAEQALEYVQEMKGEDYIYLGPRSMCLCSFPDSEYKITHINFFARRHGETLDSLLFAALEHGPVRKVVDCCSVPLFKAGDGVVPCIKHPPEVDCSECSKFGDAALCFEVEEEACCLSWSSWPPA